MTDFTLAAVLSFANIYRSNLPKSKSKNKKPGFITIYFLSYSKKIFIYPDYITEVFQIVSTLY